MNPQFSAGLAEMHVRERLREAADARRAHAARLKPRRRYGIENTALLVAPVPREPRPAHRRDGQRHDALVVSVVPQPRSAHPEAGAVVVPGELVTAGPRS
jgi:hypothetical protein